MNKFYFVFLIFLAAYEDSCWGLFGEGASLPSLIVAHHFRLPQPSKVSSRSKHASANFFIPSRVGPVLRANIHRRFASISHVVHGIAVLVVIRNVRHHWEIRWESSQVKFTPWKILWVIQPSKAYRSRKVIHATLELKALWHRTIHQYLISLFSIKQVARTSHQAFQDRSLSTSCVQLLQTLHTESLSNCRVLRWSWFWLWSL